jgi:hypothetical protein
LLLEGSDLETNYFDFGKVYINFDPIKKNKKRIFTRFMEIDFKGIDFVIKKIKDAVYYPFVIDSCVIIQ